MKKNVNRFIMAGSILLVIAFAMLVMHGYGVYRNTQVLKKQDGFDYAVYIGLPKSGGNVVTKGEAVECLKQMYHVVKPEENGNCFEMGILTIRLQDTDCLLDFELNQDTGELCAPSMVLKNGEQNGWLNEGRMWTEEEYNTAKRVAVINNGENSEAEYEVGDFVTFNGEQYQIVGDWVLREGIYVPLTTVEDTAAVSGLALYFTEKITQNTYSRIEQYFINYFGDRAEVEMPSDLYNGDTYFSGNRIFFWLVPGIVFFLFGVILIQKRMYPQGTGVGLICADIAAFACGVFFFVIVIHPQLREMYPYVHFVYTLKVLAIFGVASVTGVCIGYAFRPRTIRSAKRMLYMMSFLYSLGFIVSVVLLSQPCKEYIKYEKPLKSILTSDGYYFHADAVNLSVDGQERSSHDSGEVESALKSACVDSCYYMFWDVVEAGKGNAAFTVYDDKLAGIYVPAMEEGCWLTQKKTGNNHFYAVVSPNEKGWTVGTVLMMKSSTVQDVEPVEVEIIGVLEKNARVIGSVSAVAFEPGEDYRTFYSDLSGTSMPVQFFLLKSNVDQVLGTEKIKNTVTDESYSIIQPYVGNAMFITYDKGITQEERSYNEKTLREIVLIDAMRSLESISRVDRRQWIGKMMPMVTGSILFLWMALMQMITCRQMRKEGDADAQI